MTEPTQPPPRATAEQAHKLLAGKEMCVRVGTLKKLNRKERRARRLELNAKKGR